MSASAVIAGKMFDIGASHLAPGRAASEIPDAAAPYILGEIPPEDATARAQAEAAAARNARVYWIIGGVATGFLIYAVLRTASTRTNHPRRFRYQD